ncbi:MAG TPA: PKD domain-containing protein [Ferruginibacter sp.]|nr:PKD domain-containing protein [Ferruginibacter sp.]HMP22152.1 PKD domain-containing protein [Ferruginibacter sp.]
MKGNSSGRRKHTLIVGHNDVNFKKGMLKNVTTSIKYAAIVICCLFLCFKATAQVKANFTADTTKGCSPLVIQFVNTSLGNGLQYRWDLGNGVISSLQHPSTIYVTPGKYKVSLTVKGSAGVDSLVQENYIEVYFPPVADFSSSTMPECSPFPIQFTDKSNARSGEIVSWKWDFGDGGSSAVQHPVHSFTIPGEKDITLEVMNSYGCQAAISHPGLLEVPVAVIAGFEHTRSATCKPPVQIGFKNTSTGTANMLYQWEFGDGTISSDTDPTHNFKNAGQFKVKLTAFSPDGCKSIFEKTIIIDSVLPGFSPTAACVGQEFIFTTTGTNYVPGCSWNFGDGTSAEVFSPVKQYNTAGNYTVTLITDYGACSDTAVQQLTVAPKPVFSADITTACKAPLKVQFSSNLPADAGLFWDFGDGTTSLDANPSHIYQAAGNYTVMLISGCGDTALVTDYIKIQLPVIRFPGLPIERCLPYTHKYTTTVTSPVPIESYLWDFGNGATSTEVSPGTTFTQPGKYPLKLTVTTADGCIVSRTLPAAIVTGHRPTADFNTSLFTACSKTPIKFTNLSSDGADSWVWIFGDGDTSQLQHPLHYFKDTGLLNITLVAKSFGCADTIVKLKAVHIMPPISRFDIISSCETPNHKLFENLAVGADSMIWDFGDGTISNDYSTEHIYDNPGVYKVKLTVHNDSTGCSSELSKNTEVFFSAKADFTVSATATCAGQPLQFTVVHPERTDIKSLHWDFGDGKKVNATVNANTSFNFIHTYNKRGEYTVLLVTVNKMNCVDTILKKNLVVVNAAQADFVADRQTLCPGAAVSFTGLNTGLLPITRWEWTFGNGNLDTSLYPVGSQVYNNPGTYTVALKVTDSIGCTGYIRKTGYIKVSRPTAKFITADTASCPQGKVRFDNLSSGATLQYHWDFGDGNTSSVSKPEHAYDAAGKYTVLLAVVDQFGCTDTMVQQEYITILQPLANFVVSDSVSSCPPFFVDFNNLSLGYHQLHWDFGDGNTSAMQHPSHSYTMPGLYTATLKAIAPGGCIATATANMHVGGPSGSFTINTPVGCDTLMAHFTGASANTVNYTWDFGDGAIAVKKAAAIQHLYNVPGQYQPKMIVEDSAGCRVVVESEVRVKIISVQAGFSLPQQVFCDSAVLQFAPHISANENISTYFWQFGDGSVSNQQQPSHTFGAGLYVPELQVITESGCKAVYTGTVPVSVQSSPLVTVKGTLTGCTPFSTDLYAEPAEGSVPVQQWFWSFNNGYTDTTRIPGIVTFQKPGTYTADLMAMAVNGCSTLVHTTMHADAAPAVKAQALEEAICSGGSTVLQATGAVSYSWEPAPGLNCYDCAAPVVTPGATAVYTVKGISVNGCTANAQVKVEVIQPLRVTHTAAKQMCSGGSVQLEAAGAAKYAWWPSVGLSHPMAAVTQASPTSTTVYRVIGTDSKGCYNDTGFVKVEVVPAPKVDAGEDKVINAGQTVELVPVISPDVTEVYWSPTGSQFRNIYPGIAVKPEETTEYTAEVLNRAGCRARDKVKISVLCNGTNLYLPNTFSPNGDGVNDVFYPRGTGIGLIRSLRIFSRGGQLVFEKNNFRPNDPGNGWNGQYKGRPLGDDVFVYTVDFVCENNQGAALNGNVYLLK